MSRTPRTPAEWQKAVDAAAAARTIADCQMYGVIEGGPEINISRCDLILARGAQKNIRPSKSKVELALEMIAEINREAKPR